MWGGSAEGARCKLFEEGTGKGMVGVGEVKPGVTSWTGYLQLCAILEDLVRDCERQ